MISERVAVTSGVAEASGVVKPGRPLLKLSMISERVAVTSGVAGTSGVVKPGRPLLKLPMMSETVAVISPVAGGVGNRFDKLVSVASRSVVESPVSGRQVKMSTLRPLSPTSARRKVHEPQQGSIPRSPSMIGIVQNAPSGKQVPVLSGGKIPERDGVLISLVKLPMISETVAVTSGVVNGPPGVGNAGVPVKLARESDSSERDV
jgi:hypothetical protein